HPSRSTPSTSAASRCSAEAGWGPESRDGWCGRPARFAPLPSPGARPAEDRVLGQLALEARGWSVARVEGRGQRQLQQLGADAHHLTAEIGLGHLASDAPGEDGVAHKRMVRDHVANASWRVAWRVQGGELELAELELVTIDQVAVRRSQELLGVGGMDGGLAAGEVLEVVFACHMAGVAVGGQYPADGHAVQLLGDLVGG